MSISSLPVRPILSALRRHRTTTLLIVVEVALTCAIVCNAVFLIYERLARIDRPSGVAEDELVTVQVIGIDAKADAEALTAEDLRALRGLPGVAAASVSNMVPFGNSSWNSSVTTSKADGAASLNTAIYMGSHGLLETLGVRLVAGRALSADEYVSIDAARKGGARVSSVILTRALADRLYPGTEALGKPVYITGDQPQIVVGIVEHLARPNEANGVGSARYAAIVPVTVTHETGPYLVRARPGRRAEVLTAIEGALSKVAANRIIQPPRAFTELREAYFKPDRVMAFVLITVSLALLIVTALGIVGLASFWVQQRTRQIGIRRALGASRRDIVRYFQLENFLVATAGIALGMGLSYAINLWLMRTYGVARLPAAFLPVGAAILWLLGQIAVLGPALRASTIPPAIATRSV